jgi:hypothetical protein
MSAIVPPYAGQDQTAHINVPATIAYKYIDREEGPWAMVPYAWLYPQESGLAWVPPPVSQTDIYTAQQTYPL